LNSREAREDLIQHFRSTWAGLVATIEGLGEDMFLERTGNGWSVKDHLAHLAFWDDARADDIERISAGYESAWRLAQGSDLLNAIVHGARSALSVEQVRFEADRAHQRVLDALSSAGDRALDPALYGAASLRTTHALDHAQDIREWRVRRGV
jgi:hypothetical protein